MVRNQHIMTDRTITAIAVEGIPIIHPGDDLSRTILDAVKESEQEILEKDIIIISSKVVSIAENRIVHSKDIEVSRQARKLAEKNDFDPFQVELALKESKSIIRDDRVLITETHSGIVCNFAGVDKSNAPEGMYILLPKDADYSAELVRKSLSQEIGKSVAIIISDTQGRPWRKGSVNLAIGCAGIAPFKYNKGKYDIYGRTLEHSTVCQVDELVSLAEPLMGQANQGIPVVIIRGYIYSEDNEKARDIIRPENEDMFR
ncbi:coenzyme F420-0:L-glutamate ligase [Candidatus Thorarchaeota archaeon]|nr:MAG: coenzyme F420-0:L-glutamate ligase [Candidatus Thorarchaeota archaeon]